MGVLIQSWDLVQGDTSTNQISASERCIFNHRENVPVRNNNYNNNNNPMRK